MLGTNMGLDSGATRSWNKGEIKLSLRAHRLPQGGTSQQSEKKF